MASPALALNLLPPFELVTVDYEAERSAAIAGAKARLIAAGIGYDVENIEADPVVYLLEEVAYRRTVGLRELNAAGERLSLAYAYGPALDHIAATFYADIGVRRLSAGGVTTPRAFADHPEDWESDDAFRERIVLAPEARSPFTPGAYVYAARTSSVDIVDAVALNFSTGAGMVARRGDVLVVVLGKPGANEDMLAVTARDFIASRAITGETDTVIVQAANHIQVAVNRTLVVPRGPDASLIQGAAVANVASYGAKARKIGRVLSLAGLDNAAFVSGVETILSGTPSADIDPGPAGVVDIASISLPVVVSGG